MNAHHIEARRWFLQAQADLQIVRVLRAAGYYAPACFHAQQSAEKALKAVLFSQGSRVVWGHSVRKLARQCEGHDVAFAGIAADAALLDQFYIPTRYPNGLPSPLVPGEAYSAAQADEAQRAAERVPAVTRTFLRTRTPILDDEGDVET
ncbi:MAG: HEPN domain-containing protein [Caldilineales bacterium]|nr:HEPN domain-containing protein [Caldilineales bacterium]